VTIPALVPPIAHNENNSLPTPYQGLGARAVNTLSSKIVLALFPPNQSFFKLSLDDYAEDALKAKGVDIDEATAGFSKVERASTAWLEEAALRSAAAAMVKQLLVAGNVVQYIGTKGSVRWFGIHSFVVARDPDGNVLELVIRERVSPETLDDKTKAACDIENCKREHDKTVALFTRMWREGNQYKVSQEINAKTVPGSEGTYPLDASAYTVLRWTAISGEDYGRGLVEEYLGDFLAIDHLSRDLLKASAAAAKVIFTTKAGSTIRSKDLATAASGDVLVGNRDDVGTIGLDKFNDFRVTLERIANIKSELSEAFLMHSTVQRQAERVTAEEIQYMAQELEDALGGIYSFLSQEWQAPTIRRTLAAMTKAGKLPPLPKGITRLTITTGLEALGRGHDLNKLVMYLKTMGEIVGPQQMMMRLNDDTVFKRVATAMSIDTKDLILSEQEAQAKMQQAMAAQTMQNAAPGVATAVARNVTQPQGNQ
jgi:hypothetical protein